MAYMRTVAGGLAAAVLLLLPGVRALADDAPPAAFEVRRAVAVPTTTPYPAAARALNLPGRAMLSCTAAADGAVRDCQVAGEDPPDWGFGQSALNLVDAINVGPGAADRRVQVPVGFHLEPDEMPPDADLKTPGFFIADDKIKWLERPQASDLILTYPPEAVKQNVEGYVALACRVTADGRLSPCAITAEKPLGIGFDKAALAVAAKFRMAPRLTDGRPSAGGVIRQAMSWSLH